MGELLLVLMVVIWGSTFFLIKEHLDFVDPVGMIFYRFAAAALLLAIGLKLKKIPLFASFKAGFITGFFLWGTYVPQNIGMLYTTASNSGFITALFVAFVPVILVFVLREPPPLMRVFAAMVSLLGLWFLLGGLHGVNKGDLITMGTPVSVAFYVVSVDHYLKKDVSPAVLCFQQLFTVAFLSLIWMLIFGSPFAVTNPSTWWVIAYFTVFATLATFLVSNTVQKISTPMKVALIYALEPVFAALFAWGSGQESFTVTQMLGGSLIVLATVVSEIPIPVRQRSKA